MLITIKFGGTSVGDAERIRSAAELVHRVLEQGHRVVVVTSAMSGVTNQLVAMAEQAAVAKAEDEAQVAEFFKFSKTLEQKHLETAKRAVRNPQFVEAVAGLLYAERHGLERILFGSHLLGELSPIGYDSVVSAGERLCVPILAHCLKDLGVDAVGLGGDQAGIATDSNYGCAVPDMEKTRQGVRQALLPLLEAGKVPVVAGFYGRSDQGRVAILGRGGSDYSATLVGCALDADEIWIMTDVDGIKTTDPRLVPAAFTLPKMSYLMAAEMALLGAKVLHPKSVLPAARQGIPLRTASSFEPDKPGTWLVPGIKEEPGTVTALTLVRKGGLIRAMSNELGAEGIVPGGIIAEVRRQNVDILASATGFNGGSLLWLVGNLDLDRFAKIIQTHQTGQFKTEVQKNVAILGIVGEQVATAAGVMARVANALEQAKVNPLAVLQGATPNSIVIALPDTDQQLAGALRLLHENLGLEARKK